MKRRLMMVWIVVIVLAGLGDAAAAKVRVGWSIADLPLYSDFTAVSLDVDVELDGTYFPVRGAMTFFSSSQNATGVFTVYGSARRVNAGGFDMVLSGEFGTLRLLLDSDLGGDILYFVAPGTLASVGDLTFEGQID